MDIWGKIEEIRQKPDYIKLRYIWVIVFVCMLFVVMIWLVSFRNARVMKRTPEVKNNSIVYPVSQNISNSSSSEKTLEGLMKQ